MATVLTRPPEISAIGSVFPNPITYEIGTTDNPEIITIFDEAGVVLVANNYSFAFEGKAVFDLSGLLASFLEAKITLQKESFTDSKYSKTFYIVGSDYTEIATKRVAIASKLDSFSGDMGAYQTSDVLSNQKFMSAFDVVPQFADCFISIMHNSDKPVYVREIEYDNQNQIISDVMKLSDVTKGLIRLLVVFSLLSACQKKTVQVLTAPEQFVINPNFDTNTGWGLGFSGDLVSFSNNGKELVISKNTIGGSVVNISQTFLLPIGTYQCRIRLKAIAPFAAILDLPNGAEVFPFFGVGDYFEYVTTFEKSFSSTGDLRLSLSLNSPQTVLIDYISITATPTVASEVKSFEKQDLCGLTSVITWLSPIGGWEHYAFENTIVSAKTVGSPIEFMSYGSRQETVIQAKQRDVLQVRTVVPTEHLQGLSTILSSPEVYWRKSENELIYAKLTSNNIPLSNNKEGLFEVNLEFELPYHNS